MEQKIKATDRLLISHTAKILTGLLEEDTELERALTMLDRYYGKRKATTKILDIGCGYGRYLRALKAEGYDVTGIETNEAIARKNIKEGLPTWTLQEFQKQTLDQRVKFDVLLFSHVIEHFAPSDLLKFLDGYLDCLRPEGHALIITPLLSPYFYEDFDHVKPYQPTGLLMVFGKAQSQVQYYSRNKLHLDDLAYRRSYFRITHHRSKHIKSSLSPVLVVLECLSALCFKLSGNLIGRKDGWIGLFRKV